MFSVVAGTTFYIGGSRPEWMARVVAGDDFSDEGWTEVHGVNSLGRASGEWGLDEVVLPDWDNPDDPSIATYTKTTRPALTMLVGVGIIENDPGQLAALEAEASSDAFTFRIALPNGAQRMFVALVTSADHAFDQANSVLSWAFTLRLQSNMLRV